MLPQDPPPCPERGWLQTLPSRHRVAPLRPSSFLALLPAGPFFLEFLYLSPSFQCSPGCHGRDRLKKAPKTNKLPQRRRPSVHTSSRFPHGCAWSGQRRGLPRPWSDFARPRATARLARPSGQASGSGSWAEPTHPAAPSRASPPCSGSEHRAELGGHPRSPPTLATWWESKQLQLKPRLCKAAGRGMPVASRPQATERTSLYSADLGIQAARTSKNRTLLPQGNKGPGSRHYLSVPTPEGSHPGPVAR